MLKYGKFTGATDSSGYLELCLQVPGVFTTLLRTDPAFSGRIIESAEIWFENPVDGDYIKSITVEDTDGIVPVPFRAAFPLYPILGTRQDTALGSDNQGLFLYKTGKLTLMPPSSDGILPSQMYICIQFQKGSATVDNVYINLRWSDQT